MSKAPPARTALSRSQSLGREAAHHRRSDGENLVDIVVAEHAHPGAELGHHGAQVGHASILPRRPPGVGRPYPPGAPLHLIDDERGWPRDLVIEGAGATVVLLRVPVQAPRSVFDRCPLGVLEEGAPDVRSSCRRRDEEIFQVAIGAPRPCRRMHDAVGQADPLVIVHGEQSEHVVAALGEPLECARVVSSDSSAR